MPNDREKCKEAGCNGYLSKPIETKELISVLRCYLTTIEHPQSRQDDNQAISQAPSVIDDLIADTPASDDRPISTEPCPIHLQDIEARGINMDIILQILQTFMEDTHVHLSQLKQAIDQEDYTQLRPISHSIKGTAANMCAWDLSETARMIEKACIDNQLDSISELADQLQEQWDRIETYVSSQELLEKTECS
jgi:HPt (histidine-containing phosphotransfer) domain-containing protein